MNTTLTLVIAATIAVVVAGFIIAGLNKLRQLDVNVDEAASGIDVQLTRRADLIPNLVETVKGYAAHESETFANVTKARAGVREANTITEKAQADATMTQALMSLFAVAEAYPELRATENFQQLAADLTRTEDQLGFARQYYNDAAATLRRIMVTIPWSFLVGLSGVNRPDFYEAPEPNHEPPKVDFT